MTHYYKILTLNNKEIDSGWPNVIDIWINWLRKAQRLNSSIFFIYVCSLSNDCKNLPDIATKYAFSVRPYEFDKGL